MATRPPHDLRCAPAVGGIRHSRARATLPGDLVDESIRRVESIALITAALFTVGLVAAAALDSATQGWLPLGRAAAVGRGASALLSAIAFVLIRYAPVPRPVKRDIGLAYEVVFAATIVFTECTLLRDFGMEVGWVSLAVVWILFMRMLVPTTLVRASVTAGLSAATVPLVLLAAPSFGVPPVDDWIIGANLKSVFGAAILAVLASRVVYRLGTRVTEARELGSYRLEELLGQGGMGEVWRASHRMLKRTAAIKIIRPEFIERAGRGDASGVLKRFEHEALATARLRSVHTVTLFDFGRSEEGAFYYVMELLEGLDLENLVSRYGPLPPERAVPILVAICHSLGEAHALGMVHRDVKPSNVVLCRLGPDHDFVKVLDFGLVKEAGYEAGPAGLTEVGVATGTPAFMPPEIALGSHEPGPYTDIYMLGCVAYWLLTGELVFTGETPVSIISQHIHAAPVPVSERSELQVPAELERLVMDCLAKDPSHRPESADEVARRLSACPLQGPWSPARAAAWWEHHHPLASSA